MSRAFQLKSSRPAVVQTRAESATRCCELDPAHGSALWYACAGNRDTGVLVRRRYNGGDPPGWGLDELKRIYIVWNSASAGVPG